MAAMQKGAQTNRVYIALCSYYIDLLCALCSETNVVSMQLVCVRTQVKCEFVPILREGWLQYRREPRSMMKGWKVGWFELLADGKLSWFPSPSKQPHESRCITADHLSVCLPVRLNVSGWLADGLRSERIELGCLMAGA